MEVLNATEARKNFFNLLNRAIYGHEAVYISKAGADKLVKLEATSPGRRTLRKLAGEMTEKDADTILHAVERSDDLHNRYAAF